MGTPPPKIPAAIAEKFSSVGGGLAEPAQVSHPFRLFPFGKQLE
jgi:hypothetical protein